MRVRVCTCVYVYAQHVVTTSVQGGDSDEEEGEESSSDDGVVAVVEGLTVEEREAHRLDVEYVNKWRETVGVESKVVRTCSSQLLVLFFLLSFFCSSLCTLHTHACALLSPHTYFIFQVCEHIYIHILYTGGCPLPGGLCFCPWQRRRDLHQKKSAYGIPCQEAWAERAAQ